MTICSSYQTYTQLSISSSSGSCLNFSKGWCYLHKNTN